MEDENVWNFDPGNVYVLVLFVDGIVLFGIGDYLFDFVLRFVGREW